MICVLPFYHGDLADERRLLQWIEQLGGCKDFDALLVTQADTEWWEVQEMREIAARSFRTVLLTANDEPINRWPDAFNSLWLAAAKFIKHHMPDVWVWVEPDAAPLCSGWMNALDAAYRTCGKPYMGAIIPRGNNDSRLPEQHLAGTAVYPYDALDLIGPFCLQPGAADITSAEAVIPHAARTQLIQHFWGKMNLPPLFVEKMAPGNPINTLTPGFLRKDAVLFHRSKGGSLIKVLQQRMFPGTTRNQEFTVVLPFYNGDFHLMRKNVEWMGQLSPNTRFNAVVASDTATLRAHTDQMLGLAKGVFRNVDLFCYPAAKRHSWPESANHAFQHCARHMVSMGRPWMWFESDAVPLLPGWLDALQTRYVACGKPLMGSIVEGMGHMNGVGVYPQNFPSISPGTMTIKSGAFDTNMKKDTEKLTADASDLICHVWCIVNGQPKPFGSGPVPSFKQQKNVVDFIRPGSVLFHRCKDGSLIDRLMETKLAVK